MKVESLVLCNIIPHSGKQHQVVKSLGHSLFQIGWEDSITKAREKETCWNICSQYKNSVCVKSSIRTDPHLVAWYMAAAVQVSGSVKYNTCSQFESAGMILKAFGNLPLRYFDRTWNHKNKNYNYNLTVLQNYSQAGRLLIDFYKTLLIWAHLSSPHAIFGSIPNLYIYIYLLVCGACKGLHLKTTHLIDTFVHFDYPWVKLGHWKPRHLWHHCSYLSLLLCYLLHDNVS